MRVARSLGPGLGGAAPHRVRVGAQRVAPARAHLVEGQRSSGRSIRGGRPCGSRGGGAAPGRGSPRACAPGRRWRRTPPWPRCRSGCRAPAAGVSVGVDGHVDRRRGQGGQVGEGPLGRFSERMATRSPFSTPSARRPSDSSSTARAELVGADVVPGAVLLELEVLGLPVKLSTDAIEDVAERADLHHVPPRARAPRPGPGRAAVAAGGRRRGGRGPPRGRPAGADHSPFRPGSRT